MLGSMLDVYPELGRVRCPIEKALASSTQAQQAWVLLASAVSIGHREGGAPRHSSPSDSAGGVLQDLFRTFF